MATIMPQRSLPSRFAANRVSSSTRSFTRRSRAKWAANCTRWRCRPAHPSHDLTDWASADSLLSQALLGEILATAAANRAYSSLAKLTIRRIHGLGFAGVLSYIY